MECGISSTGLQGAWDCCSVSCAIPGYPRRAAGLVTKIFDYLPPESCATGKRVVRNLIRVCVLLSFNFANGESQSARRQDMPARETEAIILKTFPLGEADRLVSFLGRSSGRLRGVAAGARRLKNHYGSTLEILSHVQLWYVERETRDLVRIKQCELLESFFRAQSEYGPSTGLSLLRE